MGSVVDTLIEAGFAKVTGVLSAEQVSALQRGSDALFALGAVPFSDYLGKPRRTEEWRTIHYTSSAWEVVRDLLGASAELDAIVEHVVAHPEVKGTLTEILGPGYKLWQCGLRRANPRGGGQNLHQDARGEFGLSILVSDTPRHDGATAFLGGSHRWPIAYHDLGFTIRPTLIASLLGSASGRAGDVFLFFNRTWHGRFDGVCPAVALQSSFVPVGAHYPMHRPGPEVLQRLGPELRRLLDPNVGVTEVGEGLVCVGSPGQQPGGRAEARSVLTDDVPLAPGSPFRVVKRWARIKDALRVVARRARGRS